jgi:hypothetical protein
MLPLDRCRIRMPGTGRRISPAVSRSGSSAISPTCHGSNVHEMRPPINKDPAPTQTPRSATLVRASFTPVRSEADLAREMSARPASMAAQHLVKSPQCEGSKLAPSALESLFGVSSDTTQACAGCDVLRQDVTFSGSSLQFSGARLASFAPRVRRNIRRLMEASLLWVLLRAILQQQA